MFRSDETVGLVGTLFGIAACGVLVIGVLGGLRLPGTLTRTEDLSSLEAKRYELLLRRETLAQKQNSEEKEAAEVEAAIQEASRLLAASEARLPVVVKEIADRERAYGASKQSFEGYRQRYYESERLKAQGEALGSIRLRSGATYQDVYIQCVTDAGLEIRHATGKARIAPSELPAELQQRFQWDPKKTAAIREREERAARAYEEALTDHSTAPVGTMGQRVTPSAVNRLSLLRYRIYKARRAYNETLVRMHLTRGEHSVSSRANDWEQKVQAMDRDTVVMLKELEALERDLRMLEKNLGKSR